MKSRFVAFALALALTGAAGAQVSAIRVSIDSSRSQQDIGARTDAAVRAFARNFDELTSKYRQQRAARGLYRSDVPVLMPSVVRLTQNGRDLPASAASSRAVSSGITLNFDASGPEAFSATYKDFLQSVYDAAKPTMDIIFGQPAVSGTVHVANFDAAIGDRDAVAGGYFLPNNGSGIPEIRTAVYSNQEAAAINFIHTLLLAYLGPDQYGYDAFNEGLVRAATMFVARSPGALPGGLDTDLVQAVLQNSYDVGGFYDWYNQRALGGARFIAPNLVSTPLPVGGSVGGLYLLRFRMSGSAWYKVLVQYPTFIKRLNQAVQAQPSLASDVQGLVTVSQAILDSLSGSGATVEGLSFSEWFRRQYILETANTQGLKLLIEPLPITTGLAGSDFGVFLIQANWFQANAGGNEILLSGTSYPFFWEGEPVMNRVFPSAQEDRMDIAGAYGSVVPNLPDLHGGNPYRAIAEIPVQDQIQRVYLPAGAVATASSSTENNFYGTVVGLTPGNTGLQIRATFGSTSVTTPLVNNAFGTLINNAVYEGSASVLVEVIQPNNGNAVIFSRRVNKSPGSLEVDLRVNSEGIYTFPGGLPKGISAMGFPIDPFNSYIPSFLNLAPSQVLVARYNSSKAGYDFYPDVEPFKIGHGYFVHRDASVGTFAVGGRIFNQIPGSVALRPGWNLIANPLTTPVTTTQVRVVHAADFPVTYGEAVGTLIGADFFSFSPGANDAASGAPETGSFDAVSGNPVVFEPGKAYFVRVLSPEGVTLVFEPTTALLAQTRSPQSNSVPSAMLEIQLGADGKSVHAFVGLSKTATDKFDPKEDSGMPPGIGGMQAVVLGTEPLFRDVRRAGRDAFYKVRLEGLAPGVKYTLNFKLAGGALNSFGFASREGVRYQIMKPGSSYTFTAASSNQTVSIWLPGGVR